MAKIKNADYADRPHPMRIVARAGSPVEARYLPRVGLPGRAWLHPATVFLHDWVNMASQRAQG